jgi:hypothetical protein
VECEEPGLCSYTEASIGEADVAAPHLSTGLAREPEPRFSTCQGSSSRREDLEVPAHHEEIPLA